MKLDIIKNLREKNTRLFDIKNTRSVVLAASETKKELDFLNDLLDLYKKEIRLELYKEFNIGDYNG